MSIHAPDESPASVPTQDLATDAGGRGLSGRLEEAVDPVAREAAVRDPFEDLVNHAFALTANAAPPIETASIRVTRRLFLVAGTAGMAAIVTAVSTVVSVAATAVMQSLAGFEGWFYWTGIVIAILVPLVVAPLVSIQFSQLTQYLLGLEAQLQALARRDVLTGAPNRRWITERCEEAAAFAAATGRGYGVMMIDIDHFKAINDRFGHHGGDAVLRDVVRTLGLGLRPNDRFGRYGGEEFLVLTNDATPESLLAKAEALRRAIAGTPVRLEGIAIDVTASIGAAVVPGFDRSGNADAALRRADVALYRAKTGGRNRVVLDSPWPSAGAPGEFARSAAASLQVAPASGV